MSRHRRSAAYRLRDQEIDPKFTYDGIKINPLPCINCDIFPTDDKTLCLAELYYEHWRIDGTTDELFLNDPFIFSNADDIPYLKTKIHPLKWLYDLVTTKQLHVYYSLKHSTLTIVHTLMSFEIENAHFNVFTFYSNCKETEKTNKYVKRLFVFDEYHSILQMDQHDTNANNIIDFIYQEIEATTMMDMAHNSNISKIDSLILSKSLLKNDVIKLQDHQLKSIRWMLWREQDLSSSIIYTPLHRSHDLLDNIFYVHIIYGRPLHPSETSHYYSAEQYSISGGILCDEMGLGKTMCVLLTSLLNTCPDSFLLNNSAEKRHLVTKNEHEESPARKKFKSDVQSVLPCLCGDIVTVPIEQQQENTFESSIFECVHCSRSIHKKCFLQTSNNDSQAFICPYCEQRLTHSQELLSTGATLIVAPAAIIHQWLEEIEKHLDCSLNVYMYEGIVNRVPIPDRSFLAKQDFVFCSYENLKKDIYHNEVCSKEHHSTRTQVRKYEYLISPLLRLKFWRLVLDEAQMVDCPNASVSKMAQSVTAHHRWFVTGTPFHRSINDLEGIIRYLFPSVNTPKEHMSLLLRTKNKINELFMSWILTFLKCITRRTPRQCLHGLPEQYERIMCLQFSQLERVYYDRIWVECRNEFKREFQHLWERREKEKNGGVLPEHSATWSFESDGEIDMDDIHFLSSTARSCLQTPLLKLRCLCDHPQVGAHGVKHNDPALVHYYNRFHYSTNRKFSVRRHTDLLATNSTSNKDDQPFTMKDLLDLLTARELESGEDCFRLSLLNFNGLGSIYLIQYAHEATRAILENNNKNDLYYIKMAIRTYERVIEIAETYKEPFFTDSFQLAHAYYNLSHSISLLNDDDDSSTSIRSKFSSEQAMGEFNKIKERHQKQSVHEMNEAWKDFNEKLLTQKEVGNDIQVLLGNVKACIRTIENETIDIHYHVSRERQLPFTAWSGFLYTLVQEFDRLKNIRENLLIYVTALQRQPTDGDVAKMAACPKCVPERDPTNKDLCIFCECDPVMEKYNCSLQPELYSDKQINDDGSSPLVYFINEVLSKASMRSNESTRQLAKVLRTDWNDLLKKLRSENTSVRTYTQQLKQLYLSLDEMLQCTSRLEFYIGDPRDRPKKHYNRYRFNPQTIEEERTDYEQQALDYLRKVAKHRQQFYYFQEKQQEYHDSLTATNLIASQRTNCSMCHELFGDDRPDVCFFLCGHFFCNECTMQWKKHELDQRPHRTHIKCPICRREIPINSLTVLKWQNQNSTTTMTSSQKTPVEHSLLQDVSTPRIRRLIETQEHLTIQGRYGTKVDSIVSFILNLLNDDIQCPTATTTALTTTTANPKPRIKILVFSQFTDVLNVLAISLKLNAISYLQFTSTKILQQFRQDPSITVLLMPFGKGANGLNLTEAQHVILVEPQIHRSVELQAVARVRRLGQKYDTYVYRFIIDDTAEEVVLASSRTTQTRPSSNHKVVAPSDYSSTSRTSSFADFELFYEINMARKIFFKSTQSTETTTNNPLVLPELL